MGWVLTVDAHNDILRLALSTQERYQEAVDAYRTALELDPTNDSYKNNLDVAEKRVAAEAQARQQQGQQAGFAVRLCINVLLFSRSFVQNPFAAMMGGGGGATGGNPLDLTSILNNPAMINMATQMMSDPNMQNLCVALCVQT
jgi:small glutamine-rich tetratricopeptide repeat-containing protein alpha